ncbi:MAG: hypothetical protein HY716_10785 [Planctomycetes bacterium]|nr:hypothetical protein [Planctomycetota bacterium]
MDARKISWAAVLALGVGLVSEAQARSLDERVTLSFKADLSEAQAKQVADALKAMDAIESCEVKASSLSFTMKEKKCLRLLELEKAIQEADAAIDTSSLVLRDKVSLFVKVTRKG